MRRSRGINPRVFWLAVLAALIFTVWAVVNYHPASPAPAPGPHYTSETVRDYNDGFTDAKRDDCAQGFRNACEWLGSGN